MRKALFITLVLSSCMNEPRKTEKGIQHDTVWNSISKNIDTTSVVIPITDTLNFLEEDTETKKSNHYINNIKTFLEKVEEINKFIDNKFIISKNKFTVIDENKKLLLYGNYKFYLDDIYVYYLNKEYKEVVGEHRILIECFDSDCIVDITDSSKIIAINYPCFTKADCFEFIELIKELKKM